MVYLYLNNHSFTKHQLESNEEEIYQPYVDQETGLDSTTSAATPEPSIANIIFTLRWQIVCVALVFIVTFTIFPGRILKIPYANTIGLTDKPLVAKINENWATILILVFNLFDTIGRSTAGFLVACGMSERTDLLATVLRGFTLIPLLMAGVHDPLKDPHKLSDAVVIVAMALFAVTNGTCATVGMILQQKGIAPHEKEEAGFIMSTFLQTGIVTGAIIAAIL